LQLKMIRVWNSAKHGKSMHSLRVLLLLNHANRTGNKRHPALQLVAEGYEWEEKGEEKVEQEWRGRRGQVPR
jgi:hypothetical protein